MNDKRQELIDAALALFYEKGVKSVGINEILARSGVAKKTLYHHFASKDALILGALGQRHEQFIGWLARVLSGSQSVDEVIDRLFTGLDHWFNGTVEELGDFRGCFFINTAAQYTELNSEIASYCAKHKALVAQTIRRSIAEENEQAWADTIMLLKEGAITSAYVGQQVGAAKQAQQILAALRAQAKSPTLSVHNRTSR
ncbi:TetR/AcrR family transcriptional regulator [Neptunomonas marina]|uniref:TetR/AcrR family transcriptional regulator n=1 Tax=Neptunomonas marina TaxID=1815562 RepID=A0A437Q926_9GAMM|nr:TetR/AcrR family transcriptional regulator [Neptunomonas marina]RVU30929.1 TetR/AcrR family transcriptional regulator [Neptunomonas marina]